MTLQQPPSTVGGSAVAIEYFARHAAHFVVIIPREFASGTYVAHGKEGHPGEAQILSIGEHVLHEQVGVAAMVQVSTQIALLLRIHHVNIIRVFEVVTQ